VFKKVIDRLLSPYSRDKAPGKAEKQVSALPDNLRSLFIHGTIEEAQRVVQEILTRERQGASLLGRAGWEHLNDMREIAQHQGANPEQER
jgi:hypothetical protein